MPRPKQNNQPPNPVSAHKAEACKHLSPAGRKLFQFVEFDDDEQLIQEVRKHPIGLFFIWASGLIAIVVVMVATLFISSQVVESGSTGVSNESLQTVALLIGLLLSVLGVILTGINSWLYTSDVLFLTNEKIAEVEYVSLFNRRVMQLNIGKVEDITVSQNGILPHIFNYGTLLIETAGETKNPAFNYVPLPNEASQRILQAHEDYVEKFGN